MVAAGLKNARRFKQVSLPALWEIAQGKADGPIAERRRKHALRVIWDIYQSTAHPSDLRERLKKAKETALVAQLEKWKKD